MSELLAEMDNKPRRGAPARAAQNVRSALAPPEASAEDATFLCFATSLVLGFERVAL